jgi:soluble lytic murein transglycosylase
MSRERFDEVLAGKDIAPILALDEKALGERGELGPEAYFYLGRWVEDRAPAKARRKAEGEKPAAAAPPEARSAEDAPAEISPEAAAARLYRLAFEKAGGLARREAGRALAAALAGSGRWAELLSFASEHRSSEGPDWAVDRPALDAMRELDMPGALLPALDALRADFPSESGADADALVLLEAWARREAKAPGWSVPFRATLLERPATGRIAEALAILGAGGTPDPAFSEAEYRAARMRAAVFERDYGAGWRAAAPAFGSILSPNSTPAVVADAGKAFLYSGESRAGAAPFAELEAKARAAAERAPSQAVAQAERKIAWNALFYRGRFALALDRWGEAAELFARAARKAAAPADADSALWYGLAARTEAARAAAEAAKGRAQAKKGKARAAALEAAGAGEREALYAALAADAPSWSAPGRFDEAIDGLFREAVQARDWALVYRMSGELARRAEPATAARLAYAAARALELGYYAPAELGAKGSETVAAEAKARFAAIVDEARGPLHYRALAAWRSGAALDLIPPAQPDPEKPGRLPEEESFVLGFLAFGMPDQAVSEALARSGGMDRESVRRIASALAGAGRVDGSIRLAAALMERSDWDPRRSDYELLYPRPFLDEYRAIRPLPRCPEQLLFGLLRSESLFREDIVSEAGAVGLAQLMPATAGDIARALRIGPFDLKSARDNLRLGATLFSELLDETGKPLRAMMAYNAGRGRLRKWSAEAGDLPDDLMLEALGIAETRQYGRNILSASVMYGELYYGEGAARTVRYAVEGGEF